MPLLDYIIHLDEHLRVLVQNYGVWTYLILTAIIFCETGLVVTPFLPGDSLLFAAGALAGLGMLRLDILLVSLIVAAIAGDTVNYWIGNRIGERAFEGKIPLVKKQHLDRTHRFFEKYGGKTIVLARFVPIVRTMAPFVAGIGIMNYRRFVAYNIGGGVLWVTLFLVTGYLFGNLPVVEKNFTLVIFAIIALSLVPMAYEFIAHRLQAKQTQT